MHMLLTLPRDSHEPGIGAEYKIWLKKYIAKRWSESLDIKVTKKMVEQMGQDIDIYIDMIIQNSTLSLKRDQIAIREVRNTLSRVPAEQAVIEQIIEEAKQQGKEQIQEQAEKKYGPPK